MFLRTKVKFVSSHQYTDPPNPPGTSNPVETQSPIITPIPTLKPLNPRYQPTTMTAMTTKSPVQTTPLLSYGTIIAITAAAAGGICVLAFLLWALLRRAKTRRETKAQEFGERLRNGTLKRRYLRSRRRQEELELRASLRRGSQQQQQEQPRHRRDPNIVSGNSNRGGGGDYNARRATNTHGDCHRHRHRHRDNDYHNTRNNDKNNTNKFCTADERQHDYGTARRNARERRTRRRQRRQWRNQFEDMAGSRH